MPVSVVGCDRGESPSEHLAMSFVSPIIGVTPTEAEKARIIIGVVQTTIEMMAALAQRHPEYFALLAESVAAELTEMNYAVIDYAVERVPLQAT